MRRARWKSSGIFLVFAVMLAASQPLAAEVVTDRFAFVIGNGAYERLGDNEPVMNSPLNLLTPRADALGYVEALEDMNWDVINTSFSDRSLRSIENDLDVASTKITEGSEVLFVFNGHGFSDDGKNYLVGVPGSGERYGSIGDMRAGSITLEEVIRKLNVGRPSRIVLIINACGDEPLVSDASRAPVRPRFDDVDNEILVLYSSSPRGIAYDIMNNSEREELLRGDQSVGMLDTLDLDDLPTDELSTEIYSLFSRNLLPVISDKRTLLSIFTDVRLAVEAQSVFAASDRDLPILGWRQIPHVLYDTIDGSFSLSEPKVSGPVGSASSDWRQDAQICRIDPEKRDEALALRDQGLVVEGPEKNVVNACILEAALSDLGIAALGFDADGKSVIVSRTNTASAFRSQDRIARVNVVLEDQPRERYSFQSLDDFRNMLAANYFLPGSKFVFGWRRSDGTLPASGFEQRSF